MKKKDNFFLYILFATLLGACDNGDVPIEASHEESVAKERTVDHERILAADSEPGNWLSHGRGYDEQRNSLLKKINQNTVHRLGFAWEFKTGSTRGLEATPLVVDGVMYTTGTWSRVFALDAKTGEMIWQYDPQVPRAWAKKLCCDVINRGVAIWKGSVFVGTLDGRLIALDAETGELLWEVDTLVDRSSWYSITGAPRVVKDKVIIGNGGAEYGVRGYVSAYDSASGKLLWRFYTVPGDPAKPFEHPELEMAAQTWDRNRDWQQGGGGTVWDSMAYDAELDLLFIGTGNGAPWSRYERSPAGGDNLFLASILALRPDSGRLVWHYQTTPGDSWDFTATQHMILADLSIKGEMRKVIMQAPKNGFFYVLDRASGELISAEKFVYVNWASHVDLATGRPVVLDEYSNYEKQDKWVFPGPPGAHNWQPMSYSPQTGYVYIPARDIGWVFSKEGDKWFTLGADNLDELRGEQEIPPVSGYVKAWDPVQQQEAWSFSIPNFWNGGVLSTAGGLVFFGDAMGEFYALNARTGDILKQLTLGTGIIAPPISYAIDGEQYIAVMAGWGGPTATLTGNEAVLKYRNDGRIVVFKLDGDEVPLPVVAPERGPFHELTELDVSEQTLEKGGKLYFQHCGGCHGVYGSTPMLPDLRRMTPEKHRIFNEIVLGGVLEPKGMSSFADALSESDVLAIQAYIVKSTNEARLQQ